VARRLGVPAAALPDDPAELARAVRDLDRQGSLRLAAVPLKAPAAQEAFPGYPTQTDREVWNPDGSVAAADLGTLIAEAAFAPPFSNDEAPP
jgi:hypothetical protein